MFLVLSLTSVLVGVATLLLIIFLQKQKKKYSLFERYNIPGPKPSLLFGHSSYLQYNKKLFLETEKEWIQKFGKVVGYFGYPEPTVLISDLELLKKVCIKDFSNFSNRPEINLGNRPVLTEQLPRLRDHHWKFVRTLLNPTFSARKMKQMSFLMNGCAKLFVQLVEEKSKSNLEFDIYSMYQGLTLDVIAQCALALKTDCQTDENNFFLRAVRSLFKPQTRSMMIVMILRLLPFSGYILGKLYRNSEVMEMEKSVVENLQMVIEQRRQYSKQSQIVDALQLLINATDKDAKETVDEDSGDESSTVDHSNIQVTKLTDMQIIANAYLFLLAGYETTSTALAFTTYLLAKHQHIQQKLYEEISNNLGLEEEPDYVSIQKVPYVDQVINESLRLYPPIPTFVTRECKKEITIDDITIPKGCSIQAAVWTIHHDPNIWEDPEEFNPERFSPENKANYHPLQFLAFGAGPRNCIGARFALLEAKLALVHLIRKFKLVPTDRHKESLKLRQSYATLNPAEGVWIKVEPRQQQE